MKRLAFVEVTSAFLLACLRGLKAFSTNLPADAKVVGVYVDDLRDVVRVHLESGTFAEVPEGQVIPRFELLCQDADVA